MARYLSDQNKVIFKYDSGTYGFTSGNALWIGEVTEHSIADNENLIEDRYLGYASRSFGDMSQGPREVTGTLTYNAQDMRIPFYAIGSVVDTSGTQSFHEVTQVNTGSVLTAFSAGDLGPSFSFTLEDSKTAPGTGSNFVRTIDGCVADTVTITATQGEKVSVECSYIGQTLTFSSGPSSAVTENSRIPYLWSDVTLTIGGSSVETAKEFTFEINNNFEAPHYLDGTRDVSVPFPQNREYTLDVTVDLPTTYSKRWYNEYYKGGSSFNCELDFNADSATGSQHAIFVLSGCYITAMENPSVVEGTVESTITIRPMNVTGSEWTSDVNNFNFNPW